MSEPVHADTRPIAELAGPGVQVLRVRSCVARSHAAQVLKDGDLVLAVNGQPVTSYGHVESIVAACSLAAHLPSVPPHPPHQSPVSDFLSGAAHAMPAELPHSKSGTPQLLAGKSEQLHEAAVTSSKSQHQGETPRLIKAARPDSPGSGSSELHVQSQQGAVAMPQVSVTICRGSAVEEVEVQLGSEDGLGTCRLIHWCGAMFQVSKHSFTHSFTHAFTHSFTHSFIHSFIHSLYIC